MNVYKVAANRSLQKTCPPNTLAAARGEQQQMPLGWLQELVQRNTAGLCARERLPSSHLTSTGGGEGPWWLQEPPRIVSSYGPAAAAVAAASAAARGEQQQMSLGRWLRSLCPLESLSAGSLSVVETRFRTAGLPTVAAVMDAHLTEPQLIALGLTQVRIRKDVLHAIQGARLQHGGEMPLGRWLRCLGAPSVVETRFRTAGLPTVAAVVDAHLTETQLIALGLTQVRIRKDVLHAIQGARLQHGGEMPLGRWLRCLGAPSVVETRFRTAGLPTVAAVVDAHLTETQLIALGLTQVRIRKDVLHAIQGARLQRAALSAVRSAADATPVDANATSHANTATRYFSMPSLPASYLLLNSS